MGDRKSPTEIRSEAADIVDAWAAERYSCGDPEGAEVFQEAAMEIRRIALTKSSKTPEQPA